MRKENLTLVFALAAAGCGRSSEAPRFTRRDVSFRLGIGGVHDERGWNVVRIKLKNQGGDFNGTLEVHGTSGDSGDPEPERVTYRMSLDVPGKATSNKEVSFPVRAERWREAILKLEQPGFSCEFRYELPARPENPDDEKKRIRTLAMGNTPPDLASLAELAASRSGRNPSEVKVTRVAPKELSSCAAAYDAFRLVTVHGATFSDAPPGSLDALTRWVESGGTLVVFPGPEWGSGLPEALSKLLRVRPGDDRKMPEDIASRIGSASASGYYRSLEPVDGPKELDARVAYTTAIGAGSVTTFCFGPAGDSFPTAGRAPGIFASLLGPVNRAVSFAGNARNDLHALESRAQDCLNELAAFRVPERSSVVYGLALYLALGFFLPAVIFRALKRPEWTYVAVIATSAAFTFAIYRYGLLTTRQSAELCELTVLRVHEDGKAAEATSFIGLLSPVAQRVVLWNGTEGADHPLASALPQPLAPGGSDWSISSNGLFGNEQVIRADRAGRLRLDEVSLLPNEIRSFRFDYRMRLSEIGNSTLSSAGELALSNSAFQLLNQIRGGQPESGNDRQPFDVTVSLEPVFPGGEGIGERKAVTMIVREHPSEEAK